MLTVWDEQNQSTHHLEVLSAYKAHKTLGHYKDPAGTQREQYRQLKKRSEENTSFLWKCHLNRSEAWTYYYACYLPSVCYPLSCSSMTRKQLDSIQRKAMKIIVARCGFNRNTKKEILYGPLALGGASFRHLYVQQGILQTLMFIRHWRRESKAGQLLRIAIAWFQVQTGVSFSILDNVHTPLPQLESKWILSLRQFLSSIDASLQLDKPTVPQVQRLYDVHIMDVIQASNRFTAAEIRRLNYCRLYLQATTLSDISHITGTRLDLSKLDGKPSLTSSRTHGHVIYQERPSDAEWKLWKRANMLWSDANGQLLEPLGPWILPIAKQRQRHQAYMGRHTVADLDVSIWVRVDQHYIRCEPIRDLRHYRETGYTIPWESIPDATFPVEVWPHEPGKWKLTYTGNVFIPNHPGPATFEAFVQTLPPWESELLQMFDLSCDAFTVSEALSHGVRAVSDGSVWEGNQGAFGWAISTDIGERVAKGMGPARGAAPDSFRAEAYGMLGTLCFLTRLAEFTGYHEPWEGILATDSQSLLDSVIDKVSRTIRTPDHEPQRIKHVESLNVEGPEWDIVSNILTILESQPGLTLQYVKGHQDRQNSYENLSLLAQLNVDADEMATLYQISHGRQRPLALLTSTARVLLNTPHGSVTSKYSTALRFLATYGPLMRYIEERNGWSPRVGRLINWTAHGTILKKRIKHRTHYIKLVHGILPTGTQQFRKDPVRSLCASCKCEREDWMHILSCPTSSREAWRRDTEKAVEAKCTLLGTRPILQRVLIAGIHGVLNSGDNFTMDPEPHPPEIHRLIRHQNEVGWRQIFLGRFCLEWSNMQDAYCARPSDIPRSKAKTGQQWQVSIIGEIWDQWRLLWTLRNHDLHGATASQKVTAEHRDIHRNLRELYDNKALMEPSVRELMYPQVTDHLENQHGLTRTG